MHGAMKRNLIFLLAALLTLGGPSALAGPAFPGSVDFTEPATDITVQIRNHGDETFSYMTDMGGDLLVVDEIGYLRYVTEDGGAYALAGYVTMTQGGGFAGGPNVNVSDRDGEMLSKLQALLNGLAASRPSTYALTPQRIPFRYNFVGDRAQNHAQVCTEAEDNYLDDPFNFPPMQSTCPLLVLKLQFKDIKCIFSDKQWHDRVFENGITQYYRTVSNGKFTYVPLVETADTVNDGVITVTLPFDCPRYALADATNQLVQNDPVSGLYTGTDGKKYAVYNMGSLFAYAMLAAENYVDFDSLDRNGDGFLGPTELAVLVVYGGFEASFGGAWDAQGKPAVWAHSWKYNNILSDDDQKNYHYITMRVDNVRVNKYTVIGELANYTYEYDYDQHSGTPRQAQYGTATHELGHDMGLPDLYPTNGAYLPQMVNGLSLMALGNWGAAPGGEPGSTPSHLDPVSKIFLGFYNAVNIGNGEKFTLYATEPSSKYNILRVNTDDPNIYYLIENRQYTGFDAGLYEFYGPRKGGLVIWRVDQKVLSARWRSGNINNDEGHYGLMPVFVDADTTSFDPFWSAVSKPNVAVLQHAPLLMLSALSLPDGSMDLGIYREKAPAVPLTGDRFQPAPWLALGLAALIGAAALCFVGRKRYGPARK